MKRILIGEKADRSAELLTRWVFLRGLGIIFLIAFVSLWLQIAGLIGSHGILPISDLISRARQSMESARIGIDRFRLLPTLCWFSDSDAALHLQCGLGVISAIALILGFAPPLCLAASWVLYLSLATAGQDFLGFQWDNLLLETGLLALLCGPDRLLPRLSREKPPSRLAFWLPRILLFKLMFLSGVVKLTSGDALWRNLTALSVHYQTQPLPNPIAWYAHQLPMWFHKISCALMFVIELLAPFLIFGPRRLRMIGGLALAALQFGILLTGNFAFFNWLTILLCVPLFDDAALSKLLPERFSKWFLRETSSPAVTPPRVNGPKNAPALLLAALYLSISLVQIMAAFDAVPALARPIFAVYRWVSPLRSINNYGLFAVMTPDRPEIVVEGSRDGNDWREYSFRYKPGALDRRPPFVAPHQPRLDWQMWFAALSDARSNPWFIDFCLRLLQGSPEVLALLDGNPFPESPPKYIRARLYEYRFATRIERNRDGHWWKRDLKGEYLPAISLDKLTQRPGPGTVTEERAAHLAAPDPNLRMILFYGCPGAPAGRFDKSPFD